MTKKTKTTKNTARKKTAPKQQDHLNILSTACRGLAEMYPSDKTIPGLVLAWIPKKSQFYASFVRYDGGDKTVIASAYGSTLPGVIEGVLLAWKDGTKAAHSMLSAAREIGRALMGDDWND